MWLGVRHRRELGVRRDVYLSGGRTVQPSDRGQVGGPRSDAVSPNRVTDVADEKLPPAPVPVVLAGVEKPVADLLKGEVIPHSEVKLPSATTPEQDRTTQSQRDVNLMWETTQKHIALGVVGTSLVVSASLAVLGKFIGSIELQLASVVFVYGVANLVTGFYFGRTNHTRSGGVGQTEGKER